MPPLINILIRHKEGRDKEFERCIDSITDQTYTNIETIFFQDNGNQNRHYNLFCNDLKAQVTDGWFFFLDDDDYLASPTVLEELSHHLFEGALIVQFLRNKRIKKPTDKMIRDNIIRRGVIGGGCMVLHHSFKDIADWEGKPAADYDWIKAVTDKVPTRFMPLILQITDNNGRHGT